MKELQKLKVYTRQQLYTKIMLNEHRIFIENLVFGVEIATKIQQYPKENPYKVFKFINSKKDQR